MRNKLFVVAGLSSIMALSGSACALAELVLTVDAETRYDDNIYTLPTRDVDSWVAVVRPGVELLFSKGGHTFSLGGDVESGTYATSPSGKDDYVDYQVFGEAGLIINSRNRIKFALQHAHGHDDRGDARMDIPNKVVALFSPNPDEWDQDDLRIEYNFGVKEGRFRAMISGHQMDLDYVNHEFLTSLLDREEAEVTVVGYLKIAPKAEAFLEVRQKDVDYYKNAGLDRDSWEDRYFVGLQWEATAKTSGSIRYGRQEKDPSAPALKDFSSTAWELDLVWQPKSYSSLNLTASRGTSESSSVTAFKDEKAYSIRWKHDLSRRLSSSIFYTNINEDYYGIARDDETESFGVDATYTVSDNAKINAEYYYKDRDSTIAGYDYERNVVSVGVAFEF